MYATSVPQYDMGLRSYLLDFVNIFINLLQLLGEKK